MPKKRIFSGRVSFVVLLIAGAIILFGFISFFTPHETLKNNTLNTTISPKSLLDDHHAIKKFQIKKIIITSQNTNNKPLLFVNNESNPSVSIRPGEIQRWQIINNSDIDLVNFSIPGISLYVVARDGNPTTIPIAVSSELLAPKDSIELLVQGPGWGTYEVVSDGISSWRIPFMELKSESFPEFNDQIPQELVPNYDLKNVKVDTIKNIPLKSQISTISEDFGGDVEEWVVSNPFDEYAVFTVQNGIFQVIKINNSPIERYGYDTTFTIPPKGSVVIRVKKP